MTISVLWRRSSNFYTSKENYLDPVCLSRHLPIIWVKSLQRFSSREKGIRKPFPSILLKLHLIPIPSLQLKKLPGSTILKCKWKNYFLYSKNLKLKTRLKICYQCKSLPFGTKVEYIFEFWLLLPAITKIQCRGLLEFLMIHPLSPQLDVPQGRIQKCYLYYRIWLQNRAVRRQKKGASYRRLRRLSRRLHSKCCIGGFRETGLALVIVLRCDWPLCDIWFKSYEHFKIKMFLVQASYRRLEKRRRLGAF